MATPGLPWYPKLQSIIAPTETASTIGLGVIIVLCLLVMWKGDAVAKALLLVYLVSP